jgi:hypothetical protein
MPSSETTSARVVAVHRDDGEIVGAGCLVDHQVILTCRHVVEAALQPAEASTGATVLVSLVGVTERPTVKTVISKVGDGKVENDLTLLRIEGESRLVVPQVEFASPLRHGGKHYSVLGFPNGDPQGRNAGGVLHAADAAGLVQMDRGGALSVLGGFSGAPVWSSDLGAFVGLVVTELAANDVAWCIPSRLLCNFYPELPVRFRIPPKDRPVIRDYWEDDPNVDLFGTTSDDGQRKLTATVTDQGKYYDVKVRYECRRDSTTQPQGHFVTFITYPDFNRERQDAYELFARLRKDERGILYAEQELQPNDLFTVAAIGDAGATALTLNLEPLSAQRKARKR